jgi:hypothetical protein
MSFSIANNIRADISSVQFDVGMNLLDAALDPDSASNGPSAMSLALGAIGGASSFKLLRMLSSKFRKACNSFSGDTLVSTETGLKPITDIKIGDKVWAYDEESGEKTLQEIVHLILGEGEKVMVYITLASGEVIEATAGHPFYVKQDEWTWVVASELKAGDILLDTQDRTTTIKAIETVLITAFVYNLTVNNVHTYYVGEDGVLSHNAGKCKPLRINHNAKQHILRGEISPGGKITGYHSRTGGFDKGPLKLETITRRGTGRNKGVYEGVVKYVDPNGVVHRKMSTFFPNHWSPKRIMLEINSAYNKNLSRGGKMSGTVDAKSSSGIMLRLHLSDGNLINAYPIL